MPTGIRWESQFDSVECIWRLYSALSVMSLCVCVHIVFEAVCLRLFVEAGGQTWV